MEIEAPNASHDKTRILAIARAWIGTPYIHQASVKGAGCDCLGLLRGIWRELHGDEPETAPPYSPDWAEAGGRETLYGALCRHFAPVDIDDIALGDVALFRMYPHVPAKHCGIMAEQILPLDDGREPVRTLIHARQNARVQEELFLPFWRKRLVYAFRFPVS